MSYETRDYQRGGPGSFGGGYPGGGGPGLMIPVPRRGSVTFWLLVINAAVFFLDGVLARMLGVYVLPLLSEPLRPIAFWTYFSADTSVTGAQLWRWITFQFQHSTLGHLLGNLLGLFFFGPMIESYFGSRRYLAFWLLCGIGGALGYLLLWGSGVIISASWVPLLGASAGVFGTLAAAAVIAPDTRVLLFFVIPIPLRTLVWVILGIAAFVVLAQGSSPDANAGGEAAHLGGALLGFLLVKKPILLDFADRVSAPNVQAGIANKRGQRRQKQQQDHAAEVDRILAKVKDQGLHSLTAREKKVLNRDTERKRKAG